MGKSRKSFLSHWIHRRRPTFSTSSRLENSDATRYTRTPCVFNSSIRSTKPLSRVISTSIVPPGSCPTSLLAWSMISSSISVSSSQTRQPKLSSISAEADWEGNVNALYSWWVMPPNLRFISVLIQASASVTWLAVGDNGSRAVNYSGCYSC